MYYVCVSEGRISSIINYEPACVEPMRAYRISDLDYAQIQAQTHYFDVHMLCMREMPEHVLLEKTNQEHNRACLRYLKDTDWQVLRHIRQRHLGLPTSLTEEDYTELELKRQQAADSIKKL